MILTTYTVLGDSEDSPVLAVEEMAVSLVREFVFWNPGTSFGKAP